MLSSSEIAADYADCSVNDVVSIAGDEAAGGSNSPARYLGLRIAKTDDGVGSSSRPSPTDADNSPSKKSFSLKKLRFKPSRSKSSYGGF
jgi:hypothetical protein